MREGNVVGKVAEPGTEAFADDGDQGASDAGDVVDVVDATLPSSGADLPPIDFSTFVVSLRTSAVMHLEGSAEEPVNLALARQEIDLLGLLEEKTRGNLTGDEERLLSQVLFDVRTRYVARTRG